MPCEHLLIPPVYLSKMNVLETQVAIKIAREEFEKRLARNLNLLRVSAPLFVRPESGLNDNLNGVERPVQFDVKDIHADVQVVQSLAKWKRYALGRYGYPVGQGLYTDMNAIRRDEITDNLHSIYVDQWDWEKVIRREDRNPEFLKDTVRSIHRALYNTLKKLRASFPEIEVELPEEVAFIDTTELEARYPDLSPAAREEAFVREHGAAFFLGIGWPLKSGLPHDGRAPDYDDWSLNGDLVYYHKALDTRLEISSMGIRVDAESMLAQLSAAGQMERASLPFHSALIDGRLPLTIGGGIGQSRLCVLMLGKAHIGEVQCALWPADVVERFSVAGVPLL